MRNPRPRQIQLVVTRIKSRRQQVLPIKAQPRAAEISYMSALASITALPSISPTPVSGFRILAVDPDRVPLASKSMTRNPKLWGVFSYSSPGFPAHHQVHSRLLLLAWLGLAFGLPFGFSLAAPSLLLPSLMTQAPWGRLPVVGAATASPGGSPLLDVMTCAITAPG